LSTCFFLLWIVGKEFCKCNVVCQHLSYNKKKIVHILYNKKNGDNNLFFNEEDDNNNGKSGIVSMHL